MVLLCRFSPPCDSSALLVNEASSCSDIPDTLNQVWWQSGWAPRQQPQQQQQQQEGENKRFRVLTGGGGYNKAMEEEKTAASANYPADLHASDSKFSLFSILTLIESTGDVTQHRFCPHNGLPIGKMKPPRVPTWAPVLSSYCHSDFTKTVEPIWRVNNASRIHCRISSTALKHNRYLYFRWVFPFYATSYFCSTTSQPNIFLPHLSGGHMVTDYTFFPLLKCQTLRSAFKPKRHQ